MSQWSSSTTAALTCCSHTIELTPISLQDGVYTYTNGTQVTVTLDTNTTPATFSWHVEFVDNCTLRNYQSLSYVGIANN
jgi:hypothetical protein